VRLEAVVVGPGDAGSVKVMLRRGGDEQVIDVPAHKLSPSLRSPNSTFVAVVSGRDLVRVETAGPAWLEIQDKVRRVLNRDWDPIGVADAVEDEYDGYVEEIYFMLKNGSSDKTIADRLRAIETEWMGLGAASPIENLLGVVSKLRDLSLPNIGGPR
jgi:hypothetical protein